MISPVHHADPGRNSRRRKPHPPQPAYNLVCYLRVTHVRPSFLPLPTRPHPGAFDVFGVFQLITATKGLRVRRAAAVAITTGAVLATGALTAAPAQALTAPTITAKGGFLMNSATGSTLYS